MAVVSRTDTKKEGQQADGKVINPFDKGLATGKKSKLNPESDAWSKAAPPPMGKYNLKLGIAKDGVRQKETDSKEIFYSVDMECRIVSDNKDYNNVAVFPKASTYIGRGKELSTMAGLLVKMGVEVPEEADDLTILRLFCKAVKKEPILPADLDWNGWSKTDQVNVFGSMEDFPDKEEGEGKDHVVTITTKNGSRETINASLKVRKWYGKDEKEAGKAEAKTNKKITPAPETDDDDDDTAAALEGDDDDS